MIHGYARFTDGTGVALESLDAARDAWNTPHSELWLDVPEPTTRDLEELSTFLPLDGDALEDCISGEQRPRIDEFEDHVFIVLYGVPIPNGEQDEPQKLAVFCGDRFLVTVHRRPLRAIETLRQRAARRPAHFLAEGVDMVLHQIVDALVDDYLLVAEKFEALIEELEDASLDSIHDSGFMSQAAEVRRDVLGLRRLANAQRELLMPIARGDYDYIETDLKRQFAHVRDHLTQVIETCDALREQIASIRENYHASLTHRTNEIMKSLTLVATVMLPLTLVAGIYGMNLPIWPPEDFPGSFWWVISAMALIAAALVIFMRRRGWF